MEVANNVSYISSQQNAPLIGLTVHQLLEMRVREHPDREMYVFVQDNERITYKDFKYRVERLAAGLLSIGMKKGDRLAILTHIHMEFPLCLAAARSIGLVVIRIQPTFSGFIVQDILLQTKANVIVLGRTPCDLYSKLKDITAEANNETGFSNLDFVVIGVGENNKQGTHSLDNIEQIGSDPKLLEEFHQANKDVKCDDDSDIFTTSGSTGFPKLVLHTQFSVINGSKAGLAYLDSMPDKGNRKYLSPSSVHVIGEVSGMMPPLIAGITSVIPSPVYSIETTLQAIQNERCTDACFFINCLYDILNYEDVDKSDIRSLSVCFCGGSPIPLNMAEALERKHDCKLIMMHLTSSMPWDPAQIRFSAGKPLSNVEIQIVDDDGKCLPIGSVGEVWSRCTSKFRGYLRDGEYTMGDLSSEGWFKTSDLGYLDKSGILSIVGRKQDVINKGSAKLFPVPIEKVLLQHPWIHQVQVLGVPDERLGEEVCVCIRPETGVTDVTIDREEIVAYLRGKVIEDDIPGFVLVFDSFPTTSVGKIDRKLLAKQAMQRIGNKLSIDSGQLPV